MNSIPTQHLPIPRPSLVVPLEAHSCASESIGNRFPFSDPEAGRKAYDTKKAEWAKLDLHADTRLRQDWADEAFMREHIKAAGLRVSNYTEPATVSRLRTPLTRAGVQAPEILASLGTTLAGFLLLNPRLPLWAALALVLEATGRFNSRNLGATGSPVHLNREDASPY